MALTLDATSTKQIDLEEYLETVSKEAPVEDLDAILATAPIFASLLNNQELVVNALNRELRTWRNFVHRGGYTPQTFILGSTENYVIRAIFWTPASADRRFRNWEEKLYVYQRPHDHNFSFMTGGYYGAGYSTTLYEYDHSLVKGDTGESVKMRFIETTRLSKGKIMFYRASRDIHSQDYPDELSISVNMLVVNRRETLKTQYEFDFETQTVASGIENSSTAQRMLCTIAKHIGNGRTSDLLDELSVTHPNPQFRASCFDALLEREPASREQLLRTASADRDDVVRRVALSVSG